MEVRFEASDAAVAPASDLVAAVLAEYDAVAGRALRGGPSATPSDFSPPGGAYLVGFVGDTAVCGAGIKAVAPGVAELKRLYVLPEFRGRGFGPAALAALERAAEQLGYEAVRVDCQRSNWPLYLAAGYHEIADYNSNPYADILGRETPLSRIIDVAKPNLISNGSWRAPAATDRRSDRLRGAAGVRRRHRPTRRSLPKESSGLKSTRSRKHLSERSRARRHPCATRSRSSGRSREARVRARLGPPSRRSGRCPRAWRR